MRRGSRQLPTPRRWPSLAALLLLCALGCSRAPVASSPRLYRPQLRWAEGAGDPAEPRAVRSLRFEPGSGMLHCETGPGERREGPQGSVVHVWPRGGQVRIPGPFAAGSFQRVDIRARCRGVHNVLLRLEDGADAIESSTSFAGPEGVAEPEWKTLSLAFPELRQRSRPLTAVALKVDGPDCEIAAIELVETPLAAMLPAPDEPALVGLGGSYRRGVGLVPGPRLETELEVAPGDELRFSWALPEIVPAGCTAQLRLRMEAPTWTLERSFELASAPVGERRWADVSLPLGDLSGNPVRAQFALEGTPRDDLACVLANLRVERAGSRPRTVLLITSDTHRGDHLGSAGCGVEVRTPTIDALAERGVLFEDCYSTTNITSPSHTTILTGLSPRDSRITTNFSQRLSADALDLGQVFRAAGYRCFSLVSASHLGPEGADLGQSFERQVVFPGDPADAAVTRLLEWLEDVEGQDVFVWLHLLDAHYPYTPPDGFAQQYYPLDKDPYDPSLPEPVIALESLHPDQQELRDLDYPVAMYRGEISYLDEQLGRVLEHPRMADAVVAFTSDHGEVLIREEGPFSHLMLLPATLHVPLILSWPGAPAGRRVELPVDHRDLGRTILDLAGLEDVAFPGRSLLTRLEPQERAAPPRFALGGDGMHASVAVESWFLFLFLSKAEYRGLSYEPHEIALFDLKTDPRCLTDVKEARPEVAARVRALLVEWLNSVQGDGFAQTEQVSAEQLEALRALGYTASPPPTGDSWIDPLCPCERCVGYR